MLYIILALLLVFFVIGAYLFFKVNKLKDINNSLSLCTNNIEGILEKKFEIIKNLLTKINDNKLNSEFDYKSGFTLDEKEQCLFDASYNISKYLKENKIDVKNDLDNLNNIEENLDGLKDFYNANVLVYNEIFLKKYINKIYRLFKFSDYKAFKIRKLEEYEIFKI